MSSISDLIKFSFLNFLHEISLFLFKIWNDIRLSWDPARFGGIEHVWVSYTDVWIPENTQADT